MAEYFISLIQFLEAVILPLIFLGIVLVFVNEAVDIDIDYEEEE